MSTDPKLTEKKPDALTAGGKSIPVRVLRFREPMDIPGKNVATSVTTSTQANVSRWDIEYLPHLRHHRVTYQPLDGAPQVLMLHETTCSWEPA